MGRKRLAIALIFIGAAALSLWALLIINPLKPKPTEEQPNASREEVPEQTDQEADKTEGATEETDKETVTAEPTEE